MYKYSCRTGTLSTQLPPQMLQRLTQTLKAVSFILPVLCLIRKARPSNHIFLKRITSKYPPLFEKYSSIVNGGDIQFLRLFPCCIHTGGGGRVGRVNGLRGTESVIRSSKEGYGKENPRRSKDVCDESDAKCD